MDITDAWVKFLTEVVPSAEAVSYAQERKFMAGLTWTIPGEIWNKGNSHKLTDLGYSGGPSKMTQLKRNYYNPESIEEAREKMQSRPGQTVTSVGISTIAGAKVKSSQGHCIRAVTVNYFSPKVTPARKPVLSVDIFYRTTELLRKFGADLLFLHEFLIPEILKDNPWGMEPTHVRFHFSTCFFSALFIPVLYQFVEPALFLGRLKAHTGDILFYRRCMFRTKTMLERDFSHYKFQSRRNMQKLAQRFMEEGKINKKKVAKLFKEE